MRVSGYKNAIRAAAFLLVFCAAFWWVQELVTPDYNWPSDSDRFSDSVRGLYKEPSDSLQALWVGTSHMRCGITPMVIYRESGIRSYNLSTNGQSIGLSYARLKLAFERCAPKLVVFEVSSCFQKESTNKKEGMWRKVMDTLSWYRLRDKYVIARDLGDLNGWGFSDTASGLLPLLRYHTRYLLSASDFATDNRERLNFMKGYCFRATKKPVKAADAGANDAKADGAAAEPDAALVKMMKYNRQYVDKIAELCRKYGCELAFVKIPVNASREGYHSYWDWEKHEMIADMAEELGCRFVDLNYEDVGIDWLSDTSDNGRHMNSLGARKVCRFLAKWLEENYSFFDTSVSADVAAGWDRQLELYSFEERLYDLKMESDINAYMDRLSEGDYTVFAAATGTFGETWDGAALEKLADAVGAESEWREALRSPDGGAFVAAGSGGEKLRGNMDAKKCAAKGSLAGGADYELSGKVAKSGGAAIRVGSQTYKCEGEGLLIVVYDDALGCVVDSVTFSVKGDAIKSAHDLSGKGMLRRALAGYEEAFMKGA